MSIKVMSWVWADSPAEGSDRLVLLAIADEANDVGYCWPGFPRLARKARVSRRTVIRSVQALEASGELLVRRGGDGPGDSNRYLVVMGRDVEELIEQFGMGANLALGKGDNDDAMGDNDDALRVSPVAPDPSTNPSMNPPAGSAPLAQRASPASEDGQPAFRDAGVEEVQRAREPIPASSVAAVRALRSQLRGEAAAADAGQLISDEERALVDALDG